MSLENIPPGRTAHESSLRLHCADTDGLTNPANDTPPFNPHSDGIVLRTLIEQMGRGVDGWKLKAALEAVETLVRHLFDTCHSEVNRPEREAWDRILLLATLLGYRDLLEALGGNSRSISTRLATWQSECTDRSHSP